MTHGQRTQEQAPGKPLFHKPQEAQAHVNPGARVALLAGATPGLSLPLPDLVSPGQRLCSPSLSPASLFSRLSLFICLLNLFLPRLLLRRSLSCHPRPVLSGSAVPVRGTPPPPLPASPALGSPSVTGCSRCPCHRPPSGPALLRFLAVKRQKAPGGDGLGASPPPPDVGGAQGWGRAISPGARVHAPRPGPPGARADGLHGELGVLRGAGTRAPLWPPAPGESSGPSAGAVLGARGFGPGREPAAPASGRALR